MVPPGPQGSRDAVTEVVAQGCRHRDAGTGIQVQGCRHRDAGAEMLLAKVVK